MIITDDNTVFCFIDELPDDSEPFMEMCIACDNLPGERDGRKPNSFAAVHILTPPQQQWVAHTHTEVVEVTV